MVAHLFLTLQLFNYLLEVYFADLAGFTQWSSTRTPSDVFYLLEALYGEVSTNKDLGHRTAPLAPTDPSNSSLIFCSV